MTTTTEQELIDAIHKAALEGTQGETHLHKSALWVASVTLMADVLLRSDEFTRARLMHELPERLRRAMEHLAEVGREVRAAPTAFPRTPSRHWGWKHDGGFSLCRRHQSGLNVHDT